MRVIADLLRLEVCRDGDDEASDEDVQKAISRAESTEELDR